MTGELGPCNVWFWIRIILVYAGSVSVVCVIDKIFLAVTYLWHLFILLLCAYRFIVLHILQLYNFGPLDLNWTN